MQSNSIAGTLIGILSQFGEAACSDSLWQSLIVRRGKGLSISTWDETHQVTTWDETHQVTTWDETHQVTTGNETHQVTTWDETHQVATWDRMQ